MKKLLITLLVLVLLIGGAVTYININGQEDLRRAVETYGPRFTQSEITLGGVDWSLIAGSAALENLSISNPQGSQTPTAFQVKRVRIDLEPLSLLDEAVHIEEISIVAPQISCEWGGKKSCTNFDALQRNVEEAVGPLSAEEEETTEGKKLIIDQFALTDAKVDVLLTQLGNRQLSINIPNIELEGIGQESGGATPAEVAQEATGIITRRIATVIAPQIAQAIAEGALGTAGDLKDTAVGGAEGAVKGVTGTLGGLFGKKKSDETSDDDPENE